MIQPNEPLVENLCTEIVLVWNFHCRDLSNIDNQLKSLKVWRINFRELDLLYIFLLFSGTNQKFLAREQNPDFYLAFFDFTL